MARSAMLRAIFVEEGRQRFHFADDAVRDPFRAIMRTTNTEREGRRSKRLPIQGGDTHA
jgi:hypothetical protein